MSSIIVRNLNLRYPVYESDARSLKRNVFQLATGGTLVKTKANEIMAVDALKDVSFSLEKGDNLGVIGHNGAGKSTLLKVLAGIYEADSGVVEINGDVSALLSMNVGMQMEATAYENIITSCMIYGYSKQQLQNVIEDVEVFTGLGNYLAMPVKTYSSGMAVRLAFAIATAIIPDILLLDEIVGAGDASFIDKATARLNRLVDRSNILILASHADAVIQKFCNKVIWLDSGCVRGFGATEEMLLNYQNEVNKNRN